MNRKEWFDFATERERLLFQSQRESPLARRVRQMEEERSIRPPLLHPYSQDLSQQITENEMVKVEDDEKRNRLIKKFNPSEKFIDYNSNQPLDRKLSIPEKEEQVIAFSRRIRLSGFERTHDNVARFVREVLFEMRSRPTIYLNGQIQTDPGKYRSLSDIYNVCRFYFPRILLVSVIKALYSERSITVGNQTYILHSQFCGVIHKRVYDYRTSGSNRDEGATDEFGYTVSDYDQIASNN